MQEFIQMPEKLHLCLCRSSYKCLKNCTFVYAGVYSNLLTTYFLTVCFIDLHFVVVDISRIVCGEFGSPHLGKAAAAARAARPIAIRVCCVLVCPDWDS